VPIDPNIWGELAIGALRVAPINCAVSGCEGLALATSAIELRLMTLTGTSSPEPSVTKSEGPGTPGLGSPGSNSAKTERERNSMLRR